jgi:hypothetical protein
VTITAPSLTLPRLWHERSVLLVRSTDALRMCRDGYEELPRQQTESFVAELQRRPAPDVRSFISATRLSPLPLVGLDDAAVFDCLRSLVRGRMVVAVRAGASAGAEDSGLAAQRALIRAVEAATGKHLSVGSRRYRLVASGSFGSMPERDQYEVVHRDAAVRILRQAAERYGAGSVAPLQEASQALSKDWRPPFQPDGLVLLQRALVVASQKPEETAALTPSALKKLRDEGWIEIDFVDAGMEPVADVEFELTLSDGQVKSGKTNGKAAIRYDGVTPGECRVRFPKIDGPVVPA